MYNFYFCNCILGLGHAAQHQSDMQVVSTARKTHQCVTLGSGRLERRLGKQHDDMLSCESVCQSSGNAASLWTTRKRPSRALIRVDVQSHEPADECGPYRVNILFNRLWNGNDSCVFQLGLFSLSVKTCSFFFYKAAAAALKMHLFQMFFAFEGFIRPCGVWSEAADRY